MPNLPGKRVAELAMNAVRAELAAARQHVAVI
jgi:hypothetical protein